MDPSRAPLGTTELLFNTLEVTDGVPPTFTPGTPVSLFDCSASTVFGINYASIAYNQTYDISRIHILCQPNKQELIYLRSLDNGVTWDAPQTIFTTNSPQGFGTFPSMTATDNGNVQIVYAYNYPIQNTKLYYISIDSAGIIGTPIVMDSLSSELPGATNRVGLCSSITYDINNSPCASYYNIDTVGFSEIGNIPFPTLRYNRIIQTVSPFMFKFKPGIIGTDGWEEVAAMPEGNYGFALTSVNQKLYAIGGATLTNKSRTSTWLYDSICDEWSEDVTTNILDISRTYLNAITMDDISGGSIYITGGMNLPTNYFEPANPALLLAGNILYTTCDGERTIMGDGWRGQEATTSFVTDISGNYTLNKDPFLPPYCTFTYIIKYA